jgi:MFS family permease
MDRLAALFSNILFITRGVQASFAVFLLPMSREFGWSLSSLALAATICMFSTGFSLPVMGRLADKYGPRTVILVGEGLAGIGILLLAFVQDLLQVYLLYGFLFGLTWMGCGMIATTALVSRWFIERRSLALTVLQSAFPLGWLCIVPLTQILIRSYGWRNSWFMLGTSIILITLIASPVLREPGGSSTRHKSDGYEATIPLEKALKIPFFLLVGVTIQVICGFTDLPFSTLWVPISVEFGIDEVTASYTLGFMAAMIFLGTVVIGSLSEKLGYKLLLTASYIIRAVSMGIPLLVKSDVGYYIFLVLLGFSFFGMVPIVSAWLGQVFGERSVGTLFGFSQFIHYMGSAVGVYAFDLLAEVYKTYHPAFHLCLILTLINILCCLLARPKAYHRFNISVKV